MAGLDGRRMIGVLTLIVLGCSALPTQTASPRGSGFPDPTGSSPASATATAAFSPPPGWPAAPFTITWSRVGGLPDRFFPTGVAATTHGILVVGYIGLVGELRDGSPFLPAAFVSSNGTDWRQVAGEVAFGSVIPADAAEDVHGRTIVVGTRQTWTDFTGPDAPPNILNDAASFVSWDLEHWTPDPDRPQLAGSLLTAVLTVGETFVGFGGLQPTRDPILGCDGACEGVGIWTSGEGLSWAPAVRESDPETVLTVPSYPLSFGYRDAAPIIWRARDGGWDRVDRPAGLGAAPTAVWGEACSVIGVSAGRTMYVSEDEGETWRPALGTKPALDGAFRVGDGWIGWSNLSDPIQGIWTSADGFNWGPTDFFGRADGSFGIEDVALSGTTLIAVGSFVDPGPFMATVEEWNEPPCLE